MAVPTFVQAGTGVVVTTGTSAVQITGTTAGNLLVLHWLEDGTAQDGSVGSFSGVTSITGTANAMEVLGVTQFAIGSPTAARQEIRIGRSTSGGTVSANGTVGASGTDIFLRWYEFGGAHGGSTVADVFEHNSTTTPSSGSGTSTTIADAGVITSGTDRLALNFIGVNDDNALGNFTGESGGDWTLAASFVTLTGTDAALGLETASMAAAGTIDGGTFVMAASDGWGVVGIAIIPAPAAADNPYPYVAGGYYPVEG